VKQFLDASVLVRYVTGEPAEQAVRAATLLRCGQPLWIDSVALLETAYVLEKVLNTPRADVVDALLDVVREPNIRLQGLDYNLVLQALMHCRPSGRVGFGDALLWAVVRYDSGEIFTFDQRFPREGLTAREP
jgi:predicted nucleic acid-binding protein